MEKKYVITNERCTWGYFTNCRRIMAIRDFGNVTTGDLGGFVYSEDNLSHDGNCWIYDDAVAANAATVQGNASLYGKSSICDYATIKDHATLDDMAVVKGTSIISDKATIFDNANIAGVSEIGGNTRVRNSPSITDGYIMSAHDYIATSPIGDKFYPITFYLNKRKEVMVTYGSFFGTLKMFEQEILHVMETDSNKKYDYECQAALLLAKARFLYTNKGKMGEA